jgi:molecular chaperone IbpA
MSNLYTAQKTHAPQTNHPKPHIPRNFIPQLIGFEEMFDIFNQATANTLKVDNYPPRNVIKLDEHTWELQFAVAGFAKEDIDLTVEGNVLSIKGKIDKPEMSDTQYLHHGISLRSFEHSVTFPEGADITPSMKDGMLRIEIKKEPVKPNIVALTIL